MPTAREIIIKAFSQATSWRKRYVERRWHNAETLYYGIVPRRTWPGTDTERASLADPLVFEQVEAAVPHITESLFLGFPVFFEVLSRDPAAAEEIRYRLSLVFDTQEVLAHLTMAIHQALLYGDGFVEIAWRNGKPAVEWADSRKVWLHPATGTWLDTAPYLIRLKTVDRQFLEGLRNEEGARVPSSSELDNLARAASLWAWTHPGSEISYQKAVQDQESFEENPRYDIIQYWSAERMIWALGSNLEVIFDRSNPYGFIPYTRAIGILTPGATYNQGVADVIGSDQEYAQGIINARLDSIALSLNPPRYKTASIAQQQRSVWRPGMEETLADANQITFYQVPPNLIAQAYAEVEQVEARASRRLGISPMMISGIPTPSNANRSATGVAAQMNMVSQRLRPFVERAETHLILPLLRKCLKMYRIFDPTFPPEPADFRLSGSSRMITRSNLAAMLPLIEQTIFSGPVLQMAASQGLALDFNEFLRFLSDVTMTTERYRFFRPMTVEEKQAQIAPEMLPKIMEARTRLEIAKGKQAADVEKARIAAGARAEAAAESSAARLASGLIPKSESRGPKE